MRGLLFAMLMGAALAPRALGGAQLGGDGIPPPAPPPPPARPPADDPRHPANGGLGSGAAQPSSQTQTSLFIDSKIDPKVPPNGPLPPNGLGMGQPAAPTNPSTAAARQSQEELAALSTARDGESVTQRAARLDNFGTEHFYRGVERIAIGIALVSQAGQDRKEGGETAGTKAMREEGLNRVAQGTHDVDVGRRTVDQANAVKSGQAALGTVGGTSNSASLHHLAFDHDKAPEATQKALALMEEASNVPANALVAAVNSGSPEQVAGLAAGAAGGGLTSGDFMSAIAAYTGGYETPAVPSAPVYSGPVPVGTPAAEPVKALAPAGAPPPEIARREVASEHRAPASGRDDPLQPLGRDQFLGTLGAAPPTAGTEFGDASENLFTRVRGQYSKRRASLVRTAASNAR